MIPSMKYHITANAHSTTMFDCLNQIYLCTAYHDATKLVGISSDRLRQFYFIYSNHIFSNNFPSEIRQTWLSIDHFYYFVNYYDALRKSVQLFFKCFPSIDWLPPKSCLPLPITDVRKADSYLSQVIFCEKKMNRRNQNLN